MKLQVLIFALIATAFRLSASDGGEVAVRPVESAYWIEAGTSHLTDTYLSPIKYSGWTLGLNYARTQAMKFDPERWVMRLSGELALDRGLNRARNAAMYQAELRLDWQMMRRWRLGHGLSVGVGGSTGISAGALYLARNGNNPVAAKAAWGVGPAAYVAWNGRVPLARVPVTLRYRASMPVAGAFFSPDYGELYYEIYLGDRHGLAHLLWPGNYISVDNLVTADLRFGATMLRLGYHGRVVSTSANHIVTRRITHAVSIGVATEWLSLSPSTRIDASTRIISSSY